MNRVLLFGGTTEGRQLAQWLARQDIPAAVCVATEYGASLLPPGVEARVGRLDGGEMETLMREGGFGRVVDATHPYAVQASENIRAAAQRAGLPCLRLLRAGMEEGGWLHADSAAHAARLAGERAGNILLTTGSKELDAFSAEGLRQRCCPRVLPALDSLSRCLELGFPPSQIICMQGPFSRALNEALIDRFAVRILITKASGRAGGFAEKAEAARAKGCELIVIDPPRQGEGHSMEEIQRILEGER